MINIILRTCSRVHALSGHPRLAGLQKPEVVLRCLRSLARSIAGTTDSKRRIRLSIVDDASDAEHIAKWELELQSLGVPVRWTHIDGRLRHSSFRAALEVARSVESDVVYFVEDDYLHYPDAISILLQSYHELQQHSPEGQVALTTYDCPDRYLRSPYPAIVLYAAGRYWRTVRHTTGTFLVSNRTLERFWELYWEFGLYGLKDGVSEGTTLNRVYGHVPCFAPIPTLAIHLQYATTVPLVLPGQTWVELWESLAT